VRFCQLRACWNTLHICNAIAILDVLVTVVPWFGLAGENLQENAQRVRSSFQDCSYVADSELH
jgi:hypothetical protein